MTTKPVLSVRDVAALLGRSEDGVRDLLAKGELPGVRIGRRWHVAADRLRAKLNDGEQPDGLTR